MRICVWVAVLALGLALLAGVDGTGRAHAAPITTNTALPVAAGEFVTRQQGVVNQSGHDPSGAERDHRVLSWVSVLGYGVTPELTIFGVLPFVNKRLVLTNPSGARVRREASGVGDARLFARYIIFQQNMPGRTFRIAPFAGVELPTGENAKRDSLGLLPAAVQPGSGSWDPFAGLIATYQTRRLELDLQGAYTRNNAARGFKLGDVARFDASLQYRLLPRMLSDETDAFLYGVAELNLIHKEKNEQAGRSDPNSGGTTLFGVLGLQYVTRRSILEAAVQVPLVQDLNGTALERAWIARAGFRLNF